MTALNAKKIACASAMVMDILGDVSAIERMTRIGASRQTSSTERTSITGSLLTLILPTEADASLTIDCPTITADTIDHSGMKRIVRNSALWAKVIPITMKGSKTNKSSVVALEK